MLVVGATLLLMNNEYPEYVGITEGVVSACGNRTTIRPPGVRSLPDLAIAHGVNAGRSEERRVGKECHSVCRSRWSPYH